MARVHDERQADVGRQLEGFVARGDGPMFAAGPMRGKLYPPSGHRVSDLRSPNGVRTRVSTLRVWSEPIS